MALIGLGLVTIAFFVVLLRLGGGLIDAIVAENQEAFNVYHHVLTRSVQVFAVYVAFSMGVDVELLSSVVLTVIETIGAYV